MTRRRRILSADEVALWQHVTREVEPLRRWHARRAEKAAASQAEAEQPKPVIAGEPASAPKTAVAPPQRRAPVAPPAPPPLQPIDRHERRKVVRGVVAIDSRIDLHGMRQAEAHGALRGFLAHCQMRGDRIALVITGKGRAEPHFHFEEDRGVLRRLVPQWLRMPDLRPFVVGFETADRAHGGEGALYVRLRRQKRGEHHP